MPNTRSRLHYLTNDRYVLRNILQIPAFNVLIAILDNCLELLLPKRSLLTPLDCPFVLENTFKTTACFVVFPRHKLSIPFLIHYQTLLVTWRLFVEAAALKVPPVMLRIVSWNDFSDVGFWIVAT